MKKVILAISAIAMTAAANAHEFTSFKPVKGNVTTELGLTGGLFNSDLKLNEGALLRGRYFITDNTAFRLGLNINSAANKENIYESNTSNNKGVVTTASHAVNINLGYEKHFKGTNRLSPFVGGDLMLGFGGNKETGDKTNGNIYAANYEFSNKTGNFTWGVRGVVGADYYFAKNVYLGVEAGLGFLNTIDGKTKVKTVIAGTETNTEFKSAGSTFNFNPSVVTGVRLGFIL